MKRIQNILLLTCIVLAVPLFGGCDQDDDEQRIEVIETTRIKAITYDSALCVSYIDGSCSEKGIIYASELTPDEGTRLTAPKGSGAQFEIALSNLEKGQTYLVHTYAVCNGQIQYSAQKSFTTLRDGEPLMQSAEPTHVTASGAMLEGYVVANGGSAILERGFCYGKIAEPTLETGSFFAVAGQIGHMTGQLAELEDGTTYNSRVYVKNALGTFYSDATPFTTLAFSKPLPTLITIDGMGTATMTATASVTSDNPLPITGRGIRYSVNKFEQGTDVAAEDNGLGEYTVVVSGLTEGQLYNVWAYAENRKGRAYSDAMTAKALVTIESIGAVSRSGEGSFSIANLGAFEAPVTEAGLCWSTSSMPTIAGDHLKYTTTETLGIGSYKGLIFHGLKPATTYYVRAYAISRYGQSYSEELSFTTREDLYDAHLRVGSEGSKLPYMNAWQIILNDVTSAGAANVPAEALSPAFAAIYSKLDQVCTDFGGSYMNGFIYRLRPTKQGGLIMQFTFYYRDAKKSLKSTGWADIQFERSADDGTFLFLQSEKIASSIYTTATPENKAALDTLFDYFKTHRFYFEWSSPDYEFRTSGTTVDETNGPVRMVPVDAPDDYWTFTNKHYTKAGDISEVDDPFK